MARATVSKATEIKKLTTLPATEEDPEGGWVELRRLAYGEKLAKDAEAMKMRFAMDSGTTQGNVDAEVSLISEFVTLMEFAKCIMNHNLTDDNDKPLNFRDPAAVRVLDPRVGDEISGLIGEMNDFERAARTSLKDDTGK
jgi:hypothetical protein